MNNKHIFGIAIFVFILSLKPSKLLADDSEETNEAVLSTERMLRDPAQRNEVIKNSDNAKRANDSALSIAGSEENLEKMYDISAQLLPMLNKEGGGDPKLMMKILEDAQRNPEAFYNRMPALVKKQITELAKSKEAQGKTQLKSP